MKEKVTPFTNVVFTNTVHTVHTREISDSNWLQTISILDECIYLP